MRDRARFVAPVPAFPVVARHRLDARYEEATGRVLRVLAPGGYGKSTQTARWLANETRAVGWVDVERVDNDPSVLLVALARALSAAGDFPDASAWTAPQDPRGFMATVVPDFA